MAGVPVFYRKSGEGSIASYSYVDIATGRAVTSFYAGDVLSGTDSGQKILYPSTFYSQDGYSDSGNNGTLDLDFDLEIDQPLRVDGKSIINIPLLARSYSTDHTVPIVMTVYARKISGATEIELISGQTNFNSPTTGAEHLVR